MSQGAGRGAIDAGTGGADVVDLNAEFPEAANIASSASWME